MRARHLKISTILLAALLLSGWASPAHAQLDIGEVRIRPSKNPAEPPGTYIAYVHINGIKKDDVLVAIKGPGEKIDIIDNRDSLQDSSKPLNYVAADHVPLSQITQFAAPNEGYLLLRLTSVKEFFKPGNKIKLTFVYEKADSQTIAPAVLLEHPRPHLLAIEQKKKEEEEAKKKAETPPVPVSMGAMAPSKPQPSWFERLFPHHD